MSEGDPLLDPPPSIALYGAGRVGLAIARRAASRSVPVLGLWNPRPLRPDRAALAEALPLRVSPAPPPVEADLWLITVPDDAVPAIAERLAAVREPRPEAAAHCAGGHGAELLDPLRDAAIPCGSWHPAMTFRGAPGDEDALGEAVVAIEGDPAARTLLGALATGLGVRSLALPGGRKALYHAALVLAANGRVALDAAAEQLLVEAGLEPSAARSVLAPLIERAERNLDEARPAEALTGPVVRGDVRTVTAQLAALEAYPALHRLYRSLAGIALNLVPEELWGEGHRRVAALMEQEPT